MCRNSATGLPPVRGELRRQPVELLGLARDPRVHDQRIEADEAPAGRLEPPAVLAEGGDEGLPALFGGELRRGRAERGRIVADVVIAGQIAAGHRQRRVEGSREFEIVGAGRGVEGEVAAVDHEIGALRVDIFTEAMEIAGQAGETAGQMGVGNLGQAKFGHALFLPPASISRPHVGTMKFRRQRVSPRAAGWGIAPASAGGNPHIGGALGKFLIKSR